MITKYRAGLSIFVVLTFALLVCISIKTMQENQAQQRYQQAVDRAAADNSYLQGQLSQAQHDGAAVSPVVAPPEPKAGSIITTQTRADFQIATDAGHSFQMEIPASWTRGQDTVQATFEGIIYDSLPNANPPSAFISITRYSSADESTCENRIKTAVLRDSYGMANFSETSVYVSGATSAAMDSGLDAAAKTIILYACTDHYFYIVTAGNLGPTESAGQTAVAALKTLTIK
jgi:hypothetical protein